MERNILSLNVDFVVLLLNGSAGVILIFVNLVIKNNAKESILANYQKINCQNVKDQASALLEEIIMAMEIKNRLDVLYVEILKNRAKISDSNK